MFCSIQSRCSRKHQSYVIALHCYLCIIAAEKKHQELSNTIMSHVAFEDKETCFATDLCVLVIQNLNKIGLNKVFYLAFLLL